MDLILRDIHLFSPADGLDEISDLHIVDGIIQKIGKARSLRKNTRELLLRKKMCVPGLYDMHVHFRDPGKTYKEDLYSGSDAAMNGGFTGVLCMPNTVPPIDSPIIVKDILDRSKNFLLNIDVAACATKNREGEQLAPILSLFETGAVAFTDDGSPIANPELMRRVLEYTSQAGTVVIQHCEDMRLSNGGVINEGLISTLMGVRGIPEISETSVIARDILITEFVKNSRYHIQHISCAMSVSLLRSAKKRNINVTGEVCPHHFILSEKECLGYNANAKMNPPLRTESDIEEILQGLRDNTIDVICTDHAPHSEYEKNQDFYEAPFGIVGLETAVGLAYTYLVKSGVISFEQMIEKMSVNPRSILALEEVRIREGEKANLTVLDTKAKWRINKERFRSRSRNTPFENYEVQCKPYCVINNDQIYFTRL